MLLAFLRESTLIVRIFRLDFDHQQINQINRTPERISASRGFILNYPFHQKKNSSILRKKVKWFIVTIDLVCTDDLYPPSQKFSHFLRHFFPKKHDGPGIKQLVTVWCGVFYNWIYKIVTAPKILIIHKKHKDKWGRVEVWKKEIIRNEQ